MFGEFTFWLMRSGYPLGATKWTKFGLQGGRATSGTEECFQGGFVGESGGSEKDLNGAGGENRLWKTAGVRKEDGT